MIFSARTIEDIQRGEDYDSRDDEIELGCSDLFSVDLPQSIRDIPERESGRLSAPIVRQSDKGRTVRGITETDGRQQSALPV